MFRESSRWLTPEIITILAVVMLFGVCPVKADTVWISGHHEIFDGDVYGEIWMYNDATADMFGGDVSKLELFDVTVIDILGGEMDILRTHDNSIINIYSCILDELHSYDNSFVYLYAYDVTYDDMTQMIEGIYYKDSSFFSIYLLHGQDTYSHITVVPEPSTIFLLSLGGLLFRKIR
jgi:hypothetical protein